MIRSILCLFGHKPSLDGRWHDGRDFRCECATCARRLIKPADERWRAFDPVSDAHPDREEVDLALQPERRR